MRRKILGRRIVPHNTRFSEWAVLIAYTTEHAFGENDLLELGVFHVKPGDALSDVLTREFSDRPISSLLVTEPLNG